MIDEEFKEKFPNYNHRLRTGASAWEQLSWYVEENERLERRISRLEEALDWALYHY